MIKVKTKRGIEFVNVLNIVNVCQDQNQYVQIWCTHGGHVETTEEFDVVVKKIEKMLIRIAGGERV